MRLAQSLLSTLVAAVSIFLAVDPAAAQFTVGGDPRVNPNDFRITKFASGLNYPNGLARLSDGSILVATSNPNGSKSFFASSGALLRFTDNWEHKTYALAARPTPGGPANTYELYFNVGSSGNFSETTDPIGLSGLR